MEDPPSSQHLLDDAALAGAKRMLRRAVQFRRDSRSSEQRTADDEARLTVMTMALDERLPGTVAAYLSTGSEPGTLQLVAWLAANGVRVLLPVLTEPGGGLRTGPTWAPYGGPDALRVGRHGILEPTTEPVPGERLAEAELVVASALAANRLGDRLGRGGGWYDRALLQAEPSRPVWVLLNDDEVLDGIPVQDWDRRVDAIVTPTAMLACQPRPGSG